MVCSYCFSNNVVKRGLRQKKLEAVQLYLCKACRKTFTPHLTRGKHYPLPVIFDAVSIYNLGYSLEQTCRIVNARHQKTPPSGALVNLQIDSLNGWTDTLKRSIVALANAVKSQFNWGVDSPGVEPGRLGVSAQPSEPAEPTPSPVSHMTITPSTLSHWLTEFKDYLSYLRLREFAVKRYAPKDTVIHATLAHRQLFRYRFHAAKCALMIQEDIQHRRFRPLQDFLELVPSECPHQYFSQGLRASEVPLTFSKTQMIVRAKQNYATKLAAFVLQSVKDNKARHEALQKFMLANDSVTVATEVPVYLTRDDLEHMQTQLGFELYTKTNTPSEVELPKLITGHIDILQIRNGQAHLLDYKPKAEKDRPIEQLTLYAMALSRLTGLRLFEFKCAWFDENDYFEFYPLHVLHKTKKAARRRNVRTIEGRYQVNQDPQRIKTIRPVEPRKKYDIL